MNGNGQAHKSPEQLAREIEEERAHIAETINALEGKLSPGEIVDRVVDYTRRHGGEFSRNLVDTVEQNPIPTVMTLLGALWLMYGQGAGRQQRGSMSEDWQSPSSASYGVDPDYEFSGEFTGGESSGDSGNLDSGKLKDKAAHLRDNLKGSSAQTKQRLSSSMHNLRERGHQMQDSAQQSIQRVSSGFNRMLQEQPLALGAIGIAIGSLLGASLPSTAQEKRLSEKMRSQTQRGSMQPSSGLQ